MHIGFVLLNCDLGAEEYIVDELRQIPQIKNAYMSLLVHMILLLKSMQSTKKSLKKLYL